MLMLPPSKIKIADFLFVLPIFALSMLIKTPTNEISEQQLAKERAEAVQVASQIKFRHSVFLVSDKKIIWLTSWNLGEWDVIKSSLKRGVGVRVDGIIFSMLTQYNRGRAVYGSRPEYTLFKSPINMIRVKDFIGMKVVNFGDCNHAKILTGLNNGVHAYPEGLPKCEEVSK